MLYPKCADFPVPKCADFSVAAIKYPAELLAASRAPGCIQSAQDFFLSPQINIQAWPPASRKNFLNASEFIFFLLNNLDFRLDSWIPFRRQNNFCYYF